MPSSSSLLLRLAATLAAAAVPAIGFTASETFMNGESIYGQPAAVADARRAVTLGQTARLNVTYGETVAFRGDSGQQFAWKFNGLDSRGVDLAKVAPASFDTKGAVAYIGRNPANRR